MHADINQQLALSLCVPQIDTRTHSHTHTIAVEHSMEFVICDASGFYNTRRVLFNQNVLFFSSFLFFFFCFQFCISWHWNWNWNCKHFHVVTQLLSRKSISKTSAQVDFISNKYIFKHHFGRNSTSIFEKHYSRSFCSLSISRSFSVTLVSAPHATAY